MLGLLVIIGRLINHFIRKYPIEILGITVGLIIGYFLPFSWFIVIALFAISITIMVADRYAL